MSEYIDIYIDTTTKVPEDATEFNYELFERFMSGGPWVAHSEYMKLRVENHKLRELVRLMWKPFCWAQSGYEVCLTDEQDAEIRDKVRELRVEVDE